MALGLTGCNSYYAMTSMGNLALPNVVPFDRYEKEITMVRLGDVISQGNLSRGERARLHFERGVISDSLGLWSLARVDFLQAAKLSPHMVAAQNSLGLYELADDNYEEALDIFNNVLDIDPDYDYAYFNRGMVLYYGERYFEAQHDFERFYKADNTDPYRVLWLYFNEQNLKPNSAQRNLRERAKNLNPDVWGSRIVAYFLRDISLSDLRDEMEEDAAGKDTQQYAEMTTETYFYLAKQALINGREGEAKSLFRLALAGQVYNFVEYRFALFELGKLDPDLDPVVVGTEDETNSKR